MAKAPETFLVVGDVHGHLQLALSFAARLQRERSAAGGSRYAGVLLCGDVGTFTPETPLDNATQNFSKTNQSELEFQYQWSVLPPSPWLEWIFRHDGLDLTCPIVMVHGNHEGFDHLARLIPSRRRLDPVEVADLPTVDSLQSIRYLPSGWRFRSPAGWTIGGVGGIERGQRAAKYHELAYIEDDAVDALLAGPQLDILITHQGPAEQQNRVGSPTLDILWKERRARSWFHGHGFINAELATINQCQILPLADIAFVGRGAKFGEPGIDGYAEVTASDTIKIQKIEPPFWRDYRQKNWTRVPEGWVSPDLAPWIP